MIQIDVWGMLCIMGVPTAATGLFVWLLQRWISKKEKKREELEGKREKLQLQLVMSVSASRLGKDFPESEQVLIQGIIDVFFEEEDGIVLLDYKTDSVAALQELRNRYETQLDYYSEALTKLMGQPVKEKLLYSFHLGKYEAIV